MCFKYRENLLNYTNSIQIDLKYILSSHDYLVLFVKYNW